MHPIRKTIRERLLALPHIPRPPRAWVIIGLVLAAWGIVFLVLHMLWRMLN